MISIEKWAGLATNASPYAIPPGAAATQVNLQVINPGQIVVRSGLANVTASGAPNRVFQIYRSPSETSERLIIQTDAGTVYIATNPT